MLAMWREHAVAPGAVQSRARDPCRQAGDEVEWVEHNVGGAIAQRLLEPIDDTSPLVGREPLMGDGGPCEVATERFELVALGGFTDGGVRGCRGRRRWVDAILTARISLGR